LSNGRGACPTDSQVDANGDRERPGQR
jgi:hypothetical protein